MQVMDKIVCCIFCIILLYVLMTKCVYDQAFTSHMISVERAEWGACVSVAQEFLRNTFLLFQQTM